ncbi:pectinesterase 3-like [Cynara cardunculus var. scolymus]|uniref:pectinesterase 3-like n=1 Tax=Cynara cardunculus var. scolymus TaxID=59895 RepID=UPI000D62BFEF|nr:pectinesterase 3-like [Cynara cardunculus var. scolymus]
MERIWGDNKNPILKERVEGKGNGDETETETDRVDRRVFHRSLKETKISLKETQKTHIKSWDTVACVNWMESYKGYGKSDLAEEQDFRRKARKRFLIILVSTLLLLALIIGAVAGTVLHKRTNHNNSPQQPPSSQLSSAQSINAVCTQTLYPDSCYSTISAMDHKSNTTDPEQLFKLSLQVALDSLSALSSLPETLMNTTDNQNDKQALEVCRTVLSDAVDNLHDSMSSMDVKSGENVLSAHKIDDLRTWLSAALTNQETCLDTLQEMGSTFLVQIKSKMQNSNEYTSNSLAIVSKILGILENLNIPIHRKLLGFPRWVGAGDRRLLQEERPTPNVTVAKDGSGDVSTINDAMAMVPKKSKNRFVIYIKEGEYLENVVLDKSFWNVMVYGDGMDKSIVSGSLNKIDGVATFDTATLGVSGKGFMAMDMGFKNTAGAAKEQAVAMRSSSDLSVFYRCSFDAFQDTLYPHSNRQFYRDCRVTGTVDFIFGNSAVVLQNCKIMPRQPLPNQFVTITAQGKKDPNEKSGISIQKCDITPLDNLTAPTYLGRPWKDYSTTVIMQSSIGGFLHPLGWAEWDKGVEPPSSIFYAEYMNSGPGSAVEKRVEWGGYKPRLSGAEAAEFTVKSLIDGGTWLPERNVMFDST